MTIQPEVVLTAPALTAVAAAGELAGDKLAGFNPDDPQYVALRDKLAELRRSAPAAQARIPQGPPLKVGMSDPRAPLIRQRFGLSPQADPGADIDLYDTQMAAAVASFQRENGLRPTGVLTPRTVAALSGGQPDRLERAIVVNMEMRRWQSRAAEPDRIEVNVPAYGLTLFRGNLPIHTARVIVGKQQNPTPIFSDRMRHLVINPYWYVPESIIAKEMAPRLAEDPDYLARRGYEVTERRGKLIVRQPPGERNALGHIKFMFPNDHSVYLHDTPSRRLFSASRRAFSHGCVRVDRPFELAAEVLGGNWSEQRLKRLVGKGERTLPLSQPLPIRLQYYTVTVGPDGRLQFYDDVYGYAARVARALGV